MSFSPFLKKFASRIRARRWVRPAPLASLAWSLNSHLQPTIQLLHSNIVLKYPLSPLARLMMIYSKSTHHRLSYTYIVTGGQILIFSIGLLYIVYPRIHLALTS